MHPSRWTRNTYHITNPVTFIPSTWATFLNPATKFCQSWATALAAPFDFPVTLCLEFFIFKFPKLTYRHSEQKYVALKVCIANYPSIERERAAYAHLRNVLATKTDLVLRTSIAEFDLPGVEGTHRCFVFEPLTIDLVTTRASHQFDEAIFKTVAFHVFRALEFLHTKARMVHCDLRAENFCLTALDQSAFQGLDTPSAHKVYSDRVIYRSVDQAIPQKLGLPVLCDFGQEWYDDTIQPFMYRAPEVVFILPWSFPADVWNAGVMLWELFERKRLLSAAHKGKRSYPQLVAEMVALMGTPPESFLLRSPSEVRQNWFNDAGDWCCVHREIQMPRLLLEEEEKVLKDAGVDNGPFLRFMRRILVWEPDKRATASELLADPWLASVSSSSTLLL